MIIDQTDSVETGSVVGADSFAAVVEEHWTSVYRLLLCISGNLHDAEELTQETFLRALGRLDSFQPGTRMRAWLLRIATNLGLDAYRKRKRARCVPLHDEHPATDQRPGYWLETAEQSQLVQAALEELSETARTVFHLRVQESLPFREIAELLDTTEEAARWHMHQARAKLLKRMNHNPD